MCPTHCPPALLANTGYTPTSTEVVRPAPSSAVKGVERAPAGSYSTVLQYFDLPAYDCSLEEERTLKAAKAVISRCCGCGGGFAVRPLAVYTIRFFIKPVSIPM